MKFLRAAIVTFISIKTNKQTNKKTVLLRYKKIRDTKGIFCAKTGSVKDRNGMNLTETEDKLRRGGKNTQKNYTVKIFMTQIITMV